MNKNFLFLLITIFVALHISSCSITDLLDFDEDLDEDLDEDVIPFSEGSIILTLKIYDSSKTPTMIPFEESIFIYDLDGNLIIDSLVPERGLELQNIAPGNYYISLKNKSDYLMVGDYFFKSNNFLKKSLDSYVPREIYSYKAFSLEPGINNIDLLAVSSHELLISFNYTKDLGKLISDNNLTYIADLFMSSLYSFDDMTSLEKMSQLQENDDVNSVSLYFIEMSLPKLNEMYLDQSQNNNVDITVSLNSESSDILKSDKKLSPGWLTVYDLEGTVKSRVAARNGKFKITNIKEGTYYLGLDYYDKFNKKYYLIGDYVFSKYDFVVQKEDIIPDWQKLVPFKYDLSKGVNLFDTLFIKKNLYVEFVQGANNAKSNFTENIIFSHNYNIDSAYFVDGQSILDSIGFLAQNPNISIVRPTYSDEQRQWMTTRN